jgi:importin-7
MQQDQPQFYASLASHLSAEEQSIIQSVFAQAEAQIVMAQQLQQQQQQQQQPQQQQAVAGQGPGVNGGAS